MKLSEELQERGFIHQHTSEYLSEVTDGKKRTVYHGIDPTADSAHAGNFVVWLLLRHLSNNGHKIIFLIGGGTGMIGDPKPDSERNLQTEEDIDIRVKKIKTQAERLVGGGKNEVIFVNNKDWLIKEGLISFLRDIGKYFTVNELIKKDAISKRLESDTGISYTEFAYPLLQAFDYLTLNREMDCDLQVGGSDQWGNIVSGVDLIRRKEQKTVHAITVPLIIDKVTGKKFGKSEGNAVWLDAKKTTPFQFYQFWLNVSDESVTEYLKLFTFLPLEDIVEIEKEFSSNPELRSAQKKLAHEVTTFVHGEEVCIAVEKVSNILFGETSIESIAEDEAVILKSSAPVCNVVIDGLVIDILLASTLATSKREARTFIESGAIELSGVKITSPDALVENKYFTNNIAILKRGKKQLCVLVLS